jgi:hypothetical protein
VIDESTIDESTIDESTIDESVIVESLIDELTIEESTIEESAIVESVIDESTINESMIDEKRREIHILIKIWRKTQSTLQSIDESTRTMWNSTIESCRFNLKCGARIIFSS